MTTASRGEPAAAYGKMATALDTAPPPAGALTPIAEGDSPPGLEVAGMDTIHAQPEQDKQARSGDAFTDRIMDGPSLPVHVIEPDPDNIRSIEEDVDEIRHLAESILQNGLLHPIVVYPIGRGGTYRISGGHRRFQAVCQLGWQTIPVTIIDTPTTTFQRLDLMAAENLQRKQLNPIERALLYKRYLDRGMRQKDLAERLHLTQSAVSQVLPLLDLPADVQQKIKTREIGWQQAIKLGTKHRNENSERRHGTYGRARTEGAAVPHFNSIHPLVDQAKALCIASAHPTYLYIGGACGPCWESTIRLDAVADSPVGAPIVPPKIRRFDNPRELLRLIRCERCGIGALDRPGDVSCHEVGADGVHRKLLRDHSFPLPVQAPEGDV